MNPLLCIVIALSFGPALLIAYAVNRKFLRAKPRREKWLWLALVYLLSSALLFFALAFAMLLTFQR